MDRPRVLPEQHTGQLRGMALDIVPYENSGQVADARKYGSEGTGKAGAVNLTSPHPYKSALEHYQARLKAAGGGTKHTKDTIPDWSGRWEGGAGFGGQAPASDTVKLLTPEYQEYYVQELKGLDRGADLERRGVLPSGRVLCRRRRRGIPADTGSRRHARRRQRQQHHALDLYRWQPALPGTVSVRQVARGIDWLLGPRHAHRPYQPDSGMEGRRL